MTILDRGSIVTLPVAFHRRLSSSLRHVVYPGAVRHRASLLMAVVLVIAACGDDDTAPTTGAPAPVTTAAPTTASPVETTAAPPVVTVAPATTTAPAPTSAPTTPPPPPTEAPAPSAVFAVTFVTMSPAGQDLVITNIGDATGSLAGLVLCQFPTYADLPDVELAPGEFVGVNLGGTVFLPPPGAKDTFRVNIGTIKPADGEVALYVGRDFGNSDTIVDYVEWGSSGHTRSSVAVGAGIWSTGDFVATTTDSTFLFAAVLPSDGSEDWEAG